MPINIFCDGACTGNGGNNQKAGIGVVIEWQGKKPLILSKGIGDRTNNEAEYEGLIEALQIIRDENIKDVKIHSDSNLMVQQVNGNWQCRDIKLKPLLFKAQKRIEWLKNNKHNIELVYIPRELNLADNPAKNGKGLKEGERILS
jgi:ribonuclease HI